MIVIRAPRVVNPAEGWIPQRLGKSALAMLAGREVVLDRFAWIDGHADVWAIFRDADALRGVVRALAEPFRAADYRGVQCDRRRADR